MLDIFAVLSYEGRSKFTKLFAYLRGDLRTDEILYWLLRIGVGMNVDLELHVQRQVNHRGT